MVVWLTARPAAAVVVLVLWVVMPRLALAGMVAVV
jgi:hypothetical protein